MQLEIRLCLRWRQLVRVPCLEERRACLFVGRCDAVGTHPLGEGLFLLLNFPLLRRAFLRGRRTCRRPRMPVPATPITRHSVKEIPAVAGRTSLVAVVVDDVGAHRVERRHVVVVVIVISLVAIHRASGRSRVSSDGRPSFAMSRPNFRHGGEFRPFLARRRYVTADSDTADDKPAARGSATWIRFTPAPRAADAGAALRTR